MTKGKSICTLYNSDGRRAELLVHWEHNGSVDTEYIYLSLVSDSRWYLRLWEALCHVFNPSSRGSHRAVAITTGAAENLAGCLNKACTSCGRTPYRPIPGMHVVHK